MPAGCMVFAQHSTAQQVPVYSVVALQVTCAPVAHSCRPAGSDRRPMLCPFEPHPLLSTTLMSKETVSPATPHHAAKPPQPPSPPPPTLVDLMVSVYLPL
jgi:hypothetical protein